MCGRTRSGLGFLLPGLLFVLGITPAWAQVRVDNPNGGEEWIGGEPRWITWTFVNVGEGVMRVDLSSDGGFTWMRIDQIDFDGDPEVSDFSRPWVVPNLSSPLCFVRVEYDWRFGVDVDTSNGVFSIQPAPTTSAVHLGGVLGEYLSFTYSFPSRPGATVLTFATFSGTGPPWILPGGATLDVVPDVLTFGLLSSSTLSTVVLDAQGAGATVPFWLPASPQLPDADVWVQGVAFVLGSGFVEATPTHQFQLL